MMHRAFLFDLFGTLVPCYPLEALRSVLGDMAEELGLPFERFEPAWAETFPLRWRREFASVEHAVRRVLDLVGHTCPPEAIAAAARRRRAFETSTLSPRQDALETLAVLRSRGVRLGLVSNCSMETVEVWETSPLSAHVDHLTFSCVIRAEKPEPAIYLQAAAALGVEPVECLFVGDGSNDELAGAKRVGMEAVLIRARDDDGSFPGRVNRDDWEGKFVSRLPDVLAFLE